MAPWALLGFDPRALRASPAPVATLPPLGTTGVTLAVGARALEVAPLEQGWALLRGADRLDGLLPSPGAALRHGDVLSLGRRQLLVHDGRAPWPSLPRALEAAVVASRASEGSLRVYDDLLLEAGVSAAPASRLGVLESLFGRGLEVSFTAGLPADARLDFTSDFTTHGLRRWAHALTTEPAFRFLRRLELVGPRLPNPRAASGWLLELVLALEAAPLPVLEAVGISALFAGANRVVLDRLARLARVTGVDGEALGDEALRTAETSEDPEVRLFRPPAPSSWFTGGEEP